jgi:hypothetical protein
VVTVGDADAIADVGVSLVELLEDRIERLDRSDIALTTPGLHGERGNDWRLTLYLYDVSENDHLSGGERPAEDPMTGVTPDRPIFLDLRYLLTAHPATGGTDGTKKTKEQHKLLGRAIQVLRDNAVLQDSELSGSLAGEDEVKVSIERESFDAVINIWNTFPDAAYRPSVSYLVSPVAMDSTRERQVQRVVQRDVEERELTQGGSDRE